MQHLSIGVTFRYSDATLIENKTSLEHSPPKLSVYWGKDGQSALVSRQRESFARLLETAGTHGRERAVRPTDNRYAVRPLVNFPVSYYTPISFSL